MALVVVHVKVASSDSEKDVVIDPFRYWTNSVCLEKVCSGICKESMDSTCRGKAEVVAYVCCEAVIFTEAYDQTWPLIVAYRNSLISFCNIPNGGLGSRRQSVNNEADCGKSSPCAGEVV